MAETKAVIYASVVLLKYMGPWNTDRIVIFAGGWCSIQENAENTKNQNQNKRIKDPMNLN